MTRRRSLQSQVETELAAAQAETKDVKARKRVLFILSAKDGKIMGSGTKTAANGIIELAGAENAITRV